MGVDIWITAVESFGFPIVVASFILFRLDKSIQRLEDVMVELVEDEDKDEK
ncbi:YvrJ family protein [Halobacillus sp. A1]|uniref:YvrJ family protein n=1 Tax=Halobacillus sp. A1 TaxID=2880262 RepID=UPI0020A681C6|nr:YvrJ family protein [Halobacillus sp. A1]MCP3030080.1 YvrJ family protein [Halobacillus sp. A1]